MNTNGTVQKVFTKGGVHYIEVFINGGFTVYQLNLWQNEYID
jgi:hypothetical protein